MAWGGGDSPSRKKAAGRERFKRSRREASSSRQNSPTIAKTTVLGLLKAAKGATRTPKIPLPKAEVVKAIKLGWRKTSQEGNLTLAQGGFPS
jgi:hypothetical protein